MPHGEGRVARTTRGGRAHPPRQRPLSQPLVQLLMIFGFGAMGTVAFVATSLVMRPGDIPNETLHLVALCAVVVLSVCLGSTIYLARASTLKALASEDSRRQLEHVLRAATRVAIIATDPRGTIRLFNSGAESILGYSAEGVIGRQSPLVFHLPTELAARGEELLPVLGRRPEGFEVLVHGVEGDAPMERHWSLRCRDGGSIRASVAVAAMRDSSGRTGGYLFVARDITAEENALAALREAKRVAEAANESKSQFVANISHEIRTPMTAILGYADLLEDAALPAGQRLEYVRTIKRNGDHLLAIINDILDMERLNSGKLPVEPSDVAIADLAGEVIDLMQVRSNDRGVGLRLRLGEDLPRRIRTDPVRLRQILVNLVGNAIKFTEEGQVVVTIATAQEGSSRRLLSVQVADTGMGIRPEQLDRLFEPFTQADSTSTRRHGGSGLGLAISRRLARLLGGDLHARSVFGEGSVFTLVLPLEGASGALPRRPTAAPTLVEAIELDRPSPRLANDTPPAPIGAAPRISCVEPTRPSAAPRADSHRGTPHQAASHRATSNRGGFDRLVEELFADLADAGIPSQTAAAAAASDPPTAPPEPPEPLRLDPPKRPGGALTGCRILLVEDGPDNRRLLSLHLSRAGAEVLIAEDGQQAVDRLRREGLDRCCDLVVMDMQMPGLDGYDATRQLRSIGFRRPIIALTAHANTSDRDKCLACGCDDYASKPIDAKALTALCRRWMPARETVAA